MEKDDYIKYGGLALGGVSAIGTGVLAFLNRAKHKKMEATISSLSSQIQQQTIELSRAKQTFEYVQQPQVVEPEPMQAQTQVPTS